MGFGSPPIDFSLFMKSLVGRSFCSHTLLVKEIKLLTPLLNLVSFLLSGSKIFNFVRSFLTHVIFVDTSPIDFSRDFVVVFIPFSQAN